MAAPLYISVADIRAQGLDATAFPDPMVTTAIMTWQAFIDRVCRQWFYPLDLTFTVDGPDADSLFFGVPIISIAEVRINYGTTALDPSYYRVYNKPEDRPNPRIKLVDCRNQAYDIFTAPLHEGKLMFRFGRQNQYVRGSFGYVEPDGTVPLLIQRALTKLVVEKLTKPIYVPPGVIPPVPPPLITGVVLEEWTDGHKIKYAQSGGELNPRAPGLAGITDDPEILGILKLYKAPIGIATPANPSGR